MEKQIASKSDSTSVRTNSQIPERSKDIGEKIISPPDQSRFPSLDGFRGISIILVIFSHIYFEDHSKGLVLNIFNGVFGVNIFFVISGFLITTLLLREKEKNGFISLKNFYIRRVLRIFPVAYLFLIVLAGLDIFFALKIGILSFLGSAFYVRNIGIYSVADFQTGHFWSLSVEEQFYIFFPFLLKKNLRIYAFTLVFLLLLIPVVIHEKFYHFPLFKIYAFDILAQLIMNSSPILIGSLTSVLIYKNKLSVKSPFSDTLLINISLFVLAAMVNNAFFKFIPSVLDTTLSSVLIMALILNNLKAGSNLFYRFLNSKLLVETGILSYSIYVWQQLFTHDQPWKHLFPGADSILLNMIALFIVSWASYNFYEKRFLALKSKFK